VYAKRVTPLKGWNSGKIVLELFSSGKLISYNKENLEILAMFRRSNIDFCVFGLQRGNFRPGILLYKNNFQSFLLKISMFKYVKIYSHKFVFFSLFFVFACIEFHRGFYNMLISLRKYLLCKGSDLNNKKYK